MYTCRYSSASSGVQIWLDDVQCSSSDLILGGCAYDTNTIDCSHSDDIAISCSTNVVSGKYAMVVVIVIYDVLCVLYIV